MLNVESQVVNLIQMNLNLKQIEYVKISRIWKEETKL